MVKASEVREQQAQERKDRLEERYSKQIKEVEELIFQAIKEDKNKIIIDSVVTVESMGQLSTLGLIIHSKEWEEFKALLEENGYNVFYLVNQVIISWDEVLTVKPLDPLLCIM